MGLSYALGVPSSFWLNLQANYDAELLSLTEEKTIRDEERIILETMQDIVSNLKKKDILPNKSTPEQQIITLRKYFHISNIANLKTLKKTVQI